MNSPENWAPDRSLTERAERLRAARELRCQRGWHEDPDHSGLCILCGYDLDEDEER